MWHLCICVSVYIPGVLEPLYSVSSYFHLPSDLYLQLMVTPIVTLTLVSISCCIVVIGTQFAHGYK